MLTLTKDQLKAMQPCGLDQRLQLFGTKKKMNAKQAFAAGAAIRDLLWVAQKLGRKDLCIKFALACAQRSAKFSTDERVQACLDATQLYINEPSEDNLAALKKARAYAAYAAADAAYAAAAAAAAYAAYAAYAAAAAAAAADAATYAAYAADAAAYAAAAKQKEIEEQKKLFIEIFN